MHGNTHVRFGERDKGNQPCGNMKWRPVPTLRAPQPSQEDRALTKRLVDAGRLLGIHVIDHLILGDGSETYYSFADEGLLP
jgi:RadC-like JAB domain